MLEVSRYSVPNPGDGWTSVSYGTGPPTDAAPVLPQPQDSGHLVATAPWAAPPLGAQNISSTPILKEELPSELKSSTPPPCWPPPCSDPPLAMGGTI